MINWGIIGAGSIARVFANGLRFSKTGRLEAIASRTAGKADALAIFGESDRLEIAMREASAAELLGLKLHDMITIEFNG